MALLEEARKYAQTDYVIEYMGKPVKDIKKSFQKAAQKAGLPDVSPHVLKHSVISWLAMDGHTVDQISDMTATTRETVTRVYRHVKPEYLEGLAGSLAPSANIAQIFSKPSQ
jgi:integrase